VKKLPVNKIIHGDCLDILPSFPNESVDMILADPPYGTTVCKWDSVIPLEPMWEQLKRVIKPNGAIVMTASQPFTTTLIASNMKMFKYCWVWEKTQSRGHLLAYKRPMQKHEDVLVFCNGTEIYNYVLTDKPKKDIRPHSVSGKAGVYNNKPVHQSQTRRIPLDKKLPESIIKFSNAQKTIHPTQKPVALMEYLIKTYTNEGETVLDFTCGSGTTCVACIKTKRNYIGIELDEKYYKIARRRVKKAKEKFNRSFRIVV